MIEKLPIPIIKSILTTIHSAGLYVRDGRAESSLYSKLREASETLNRIISREEKDEEQPFWYTLYEGLVERYIQLKIQHKKLKEQNKQLRRDYEDLKERYWNAISRLKEQTEEAERL